MVAVAFRVVEINPDHMFLFLVIFTVVISLFLMYLIWQSINNLTKKQRTERLRLLQEFTDHSLEITSWLKEHKEELERRPIATLNNQEFVDLINRDQELYETILEIYPDYSDAVMPPKEFRQYLIELAQGQHKQTH